MTRVSDRAAALTLGGVALCIGALLAATIHGDPFKRGPDEAHYLVYAKLIGNGGPGAFREAFTGFVGDENRWRFPNPLRIAYLGTAALWTRAFGPSMTSLSYLSLVSHLLLMAATYGLARRAVGNPRALFAAVLVGCSPLLLGIARRALLDGFATLFSLLAVWSFLEAVARDGARRRWLFAATFALAILAKETGVLLAPAFAAWLALERFARGRPLPVLPWIAALGAPLLFCGLVWVVGAGGTDTLLRLA